MFLRNRDPGSVPQIADPVHAFSQDFHINIVQRDALFQKLLDEIQRLAGILPQQTVHILFNLGFIGRRRCAFGMGKRHRLPGYRLGHSR